MNLRLPAPEAGALPGCATSRGGFFVAPAWSFCQGERRMGDRRGFGGGCVRSAWRRSGVSGASYMNKAIPKFYFDKRKAVELGYLGTRISLKCTSVSRHLKKISLTAVYGWKLSSFIRPVPAGTSLKIISTVTFLPS